MDRRGFLQRIGAAAAAFTAARAGVAAASQQRLAPQPPRPQPTITPGVAITADTSGFETELQRTERMLREYIKECHVVSAEATQFIDGRPGQLRVVYRTSDEPGPMDADVAKVTKNGRILDCSVLQEWSEDIDVSLLDNWGMTQKFSILGEPKYEIDVTWLVPSL